MGRRVLAVVGALALVVVAIAVRSAIDRREAPDGRDPDAEAELVVVCDTDFAAQCRTALPEATVRVEPSAATSAALLEDGAGEVDAWITSNSWFEVTQQRLASRDSTVDIGFATPLATTQVVVAAVQPRAAAITALCEGRSTWRCLGEEAGRPWAEVGGQASWGVVRTGMPAPETATGLNVLTAAAAGFFGGTDFAANDFVEGFAAWLEALGQASAPGDPDLLATLVRRQGTYDAGGVPEHLARSRSELVVLPIDQGPPIEAVAVSLSAAAPDGWPELQDALAASGWTASPPAGGPTGVLGPGVTGALYTLWKDVTR